MTRVDTRALFAAKWPALVRLARWKGLSVGRGPETVERRSRLVNALIRKLDMNEPLNPEFEGCIQTHEDVVEKLEAIEQQMADEHSLQAFKEYPLRLRSKLIRLDQNDRLKWTRLTDEWRSYLSSFLADIADCTKSKYWGQDNPRDQMRTTIGSIRAHLLNHEEGIIGPIALSERLDPLLDQLEQLTNWSKESWKENEK